MKLDRPLGPRPDLEPAYLRREVAEVIRRTATTRLEIEARDAIAREMVAAAMRRQDEGER